MHSEVLTGKFGLAATPANVGGTNYAIAGSLSYAVGGDGNLQPNPNLPSTALAAHPTVSNQSLVMIGSGGNDVTYARDTFGTSNIAGGQAFLSNQVNQLVLSISQLQAAGAQTILIDSFAG
jgi:hypothetical protein